MAVFRNTSLRAGRSTKWRSFLLVTVLSIFLVTVVTGCGSSPKATESPRGGAEEKLTLADGYAPGGNLNFSQVSGVSSKVEAATVTRKIIQNAEVDIAVTDVQAALNQAIQMAEAAGGLVSNSSIFRNNDRVSGSVTFRIPAGKFASFLTQLPKLGEVRSQHSNIQEVTEEFIDLEARVKNLEGQEQALRGLLAGSKNVADALSVERELARVRTEIDSLKGRLRFLTDQVDLSTIRLSLTEETVLEQRISASGLSGIGKRSAQAFARAVNAVFDLVGDLVVFVIGALPVVIFLAVIVIPAWFLWKWARRFLPGRKTGRGIEL